ncbi:MAG TPA: MoaD/ThiS family protein [Caulobacteraceae bacterium]
MATIAFTPHLRAVGPIQEQACPGATLAEMLDALDPGYPRLKAYVLDDQGRLRKHIAIFIDGVMTPRAAALSRPLEGSSQVYVFQALSGG